MFWEAIAVISLALAVIFYFLEFYIRQQDRKDNENYYANYRRHNKK